jgi:hypothetical protein
LRLLEVGTYDGNRAVQMLKHWNSLPGTLGAEYHGFDLFEQLTPEMSKQELSKSKLPPAMAVVQKKLDALPHVCVRLHAGNTCETLPVACESLPPMHLIFVDGGHSLSTIESDWQAVQLVMDRETITLFDDYYVNRDDYGCQHQIQVIAATMPRYTVELLDPLDHFEHTGLDIRMVRVRML